MIMEQMDKIPVYRDTGAYAQGHGEMEQFRASNPANIACQNKFERSIAANFAGMYQNRQAVQAALQKPSLKSSHPYPYKEAA